MAIEEWAKDFKSYVDELQMPRDDYKGIMEYIDDALALLKRHEPQRAIRGEAEDLPGIAFWVCPSCRIGIDYLDRFCRHCGQELKWE